MDIAKTTDFIYQSVKRENVKTLFAKNQIEMVVKLNPNLAARYIIDFINKAQITGADPALNQIHLTTYQKKINGVKVTVGVPVFSYHFFLNVANQTGEFKGVQVRSEVEDVFNPIIGDFKKMLVATATVQRKDHVPTIFKARWDECVATKKNWNTGEEEPNYMWKSKPYMMLEKTAIANAVRWAFPEATSGMYIQEEISGDEANVKPREAESEVVKEESLLEKSDEKDRAIEKVKSICAMLTKGLSSKEKSDFMEQNLGVTAFSEFTKKDLSEINATIKKLEPVSVNKPKEPKKKSAKDHTFKIEK